MNLAKLYKFPFLLFITSLFLVPALTSCGGDEEQAHHAPGVTVLTLKPQTIPLTGEFVGTTAGFREVEIRAQVSGILLKKDYTEGQIVEKGKRLFQIDPAPYQAALNQAKGTLAQAQARNYQAKLDNDRFIKLYKEDAVSKKERDDAVAAYRAAQGDLEAAKALVDNAEINLGYTTVTAPITGAVSEESFSEGNLINVGQTLTNMVQIDPIYVNFSIPSTDALRYQDMMRKGLLVPPPDNRFDVDIKLSDGSMHTGQGTVNFIDPRVDLATSSIKARAQLDNKGKSILPGQFARVYMKGYVLKNILAVPKRAVLNTQDGPIIYVVNKDNIAEKRPFKMEMALNSDYILQEGASPNEKIILEGIQKVRPGGHVTIVEENKDSTPAPGSSNATAPKNN